MKDISIRNNNNNLNDYKLSILITQSGLSYSLYSTLENRFNTLVSKSFYNKDNYLDEIKSFFNEENLIKNFKHVKIVIADDKVTIVPNVLFDELNYTKLYELNFGNEEDKIIKYSRLLKSENVIVFSIDKKLQKILDDLIPDYQLYSHSVPFVDFNYIKNKISENRQYAKMFVQVHESFIDILVFKEDNILLYNTFKFKTNNDLLYIIINIFEQLKLSQDTTEVSFSGFIETDNLVIINLRKFVRFVYLEAQNPEFKYYYKFQEILPHYFFNFLNINKCE